MDHWIQKPAAPEASGAGAIKSCALCAVLGLPDSLMQRSPRRLCAEGVRCATAASPRRRERVLKAGMRAVIATSMRSATLHWPPLSAAVIRHVQATSLTGMHASHDSMNICTAAELARACARLEIGARGGGYRGVGCF